MVPNDCTVTRALEPHHVGRLGVTGIVEEQELQPTGATGEDAEVDPSVGGSGTEREATTGRGASVWKSGA